MMNAQFQKLVSEVERLHGELMCMKSVTRGSLGGCNFPGVYLFSENDEHLYVGRGKNLKKRIPQHARDSVKDAPFAFRLARITTGKTAVTYAARDGRKELLADGTFKAQLKAQKARIGKMDIRFVRVDDPTTQALLEIYTATVLKTPHNEFTTS